MEDRPSYRVYSPADLKSIAPATLRTGSGPQKHGFFGFGMVMMVIVVFIGGATFAAQHYVDVKLAEKAAAKADSAAAAGAAGPATPSPFAMALSAPGFKSSTAVGASGSALDPGAPPSVTSAALTVPAGAASGSSPGQPAAVASATTTTTPADNSPVALAARKKTIHRRLPGAPGAGGLPTPGAASALPGVPGFVKPSSDLPTNPYAGGDDAK